MTKEEEIKLNFLRVEDLKKLAKDNDVYIKSGSLKKEYIKILIKTSITNKSLKEEINNVIKIRRNKNGDIIPLPKIPTNNQKIYSLPAKEIKTARRGKLPTAPKWEKCTSSKKESTKCVQELENKFNDSIMDTEYFKDYMEQLEKDRISWENCKSNKNEAIKCVNNLTENFKDLIPNNLNKCKENQENAFECITELQNIYKDLIPKTLNMHGNIMGIVLDKSMNKIIAVVLSDGSAYPLDKPIKYELYKQEFGEKPHKMEVRSLVPSTKNIASPLSPKSQKNIPPTLPPRPSNNIPLPPPLKVHPEDVKSLELSLKEKKNNNNFIKAENLLEQIRAGKNLKNKNEQKKIIKTTSSKDVTLENTLARAIGKRRGGIVGDDENNKESNEKLKFCKAYNLIYIKDSDACLPVSKLTKKELENIKNKYTEEELENFVNIVVGKEEKQKIKENFEQEFGEW